MTKIEQLLKSKGITEKTIYHNYAYLYNSVVEAMQELESAIREQVVIDALPKEDSAELNLVRPEPGMCSDDLRQGFDVGLEAMRLIATQSLTTREEVERPYVELLKIATEIERLLTNGVEIHPKSPIHEKLIKQLNSLTDGK